MDYAFKPAALSARQTFHLENGQLALDGGWILSLSSVSKAGFVQHRMRGTVMRRLDLWQGDTRRSLSWTGAAGDWVQDEDAYTFLDLCREAAVQLPTDTEIIWGEYGRYRWTLFLIGIVAFLGGIGLFIAALAGGVASDRLAAAAVPMVLLTVIGGVLSIGYAPWRKLPVVRSGALPAILDGIARKGREHATAPR